MPVYEYTARTATGQETTGSVKGLVADEFGTPMAGAVVVATGPSGAVNAESGKDGTFRFPRLAPGAYVVTTTFEGYQPSKAEVTVGLNPFGIAYVD